MTARNQVRIEAQSWDDVPAFATEEAERLFWRTHALGEDLLVTTPQDDPALPPARCTTGHPPNRKPR